jgi:ABC-type multidrug transport system ATPase subunit
MLTVWEHLEFIAHAYNVENYREKAESLLERFELADKRDKLGKELSKGMQQKVSLCCALLTDPQVMFFDEPMVGLDPKAIKELKEIFHELRERGASIVISTHILDSVQEVWDKVLIMKDGKVLLSKHRHEIGAGEESLEDTFFRVTEDRE